MNLLHPKRNAKLQLLLPLFVVLSLVLTSCGPATAQPTPTAVVAEPTATTATSEGGTEPTATTAAEAEATKPIAPAGKGIMTISVAQQSTWIRNFNPFSGDFRFPTVNGIYEPMMIYNTIKGELVPWLATKYEWSADNKKLTLTLRDGVKWSDHRSVHAEIVY